VGFQEEARKEREDLVEKRAAVLQVAEDEGREDLTETEDTEFRGFTAQIAEIDGQIEARNERIANWPTKRSGPATLPRRTSGRADRIADSGHARSRDVREGQRPSYLQDLARAQFFGRRRSACSSRPARHGSRSTEPEYRDLTRTDGAGGYFVPPAWLMNDYAALARAARPTANLVTNLHVPRVPTRSTSRRSALVLRPRSRRPTTRASPRPTWRTRPSSAGVKTIAGQQDVAIQALEQSPVNFDQIIFADLFADYATKLDVQVLNGANSSGEVKGICLALRHQHDRVHGHHADRCRAVLEARGRDREGSHEPVLGADCDRHAPDSLGVDAGGAGHVQPSVDRPEQRRVRRTLLATFGGVHAHSKLSARSWACLWSLTRRFPTRWVRAPTKTASS
jgi:HK97 family phage major capsid protein